MTKDKNIILENINCIEVDYSNCAHTSALTNLIQIYATDPMGGGEPIADATLARLPDEMSKRPHVFSLLMFACLRHACGSKSDSQSIPIAFANCIESFSTFKAQTVVNIHDFAVIPQVRGLGVSQALIKKIEQASKARGACKLTLEVLEGNQIAKSAYLKAGFSAYELDPGMGQALFWEKSL